MSEEQKEHQEWAREWKWAQEQEFEAWKEAFEKGKPKPSEEQQSWIDAFKEAFGMGEPKLNEEQQFWTDVLNKQEN